MDQKEYILACMAPAEKSPHQPVQIQKLIFIFQDKMGAEFGEPAFNFYPYDYGPFDPAVYQNLEELATKGLVTISGGPFSRNRAYCLTDDGLKSGLKLLSKFPTEPKKYIVQLSQWVRSLSFSQLVGAVYNAYPGMRQNSVFKD
jgi:uncharacterized protein YwgA